MALSIGWLKGGVFAACLLPLVLFIAAQAQGNGGPDPGKALVLLTGDWSMRLLLVTLLITPLRHFFRWQRLMAFRRMLGLFAGSYVVLHFLAVMTYFVGWQWGRLLEEFRERPYMSVGLMAGALILPLILTSNRWAVRRLGGRRWQSLHRSVYLIVLLACVHIVWLIRSDYTEALIYTGVTAFCLVSRLAVNKRWRQGLTFLH